MLYERKLNIDGSLCSADHTGGWVFIVHNNVGEAMAARAGTLSYAYDALHGEAAACLTSIQRASYLGMGKIQVEIDSQKLVQTVTSKSHDIFVNEHLLREIKLFARLNFSSFFIKFYPRTCNKVADALATYRASLGHESRAVWSDGVHGFLLGLVTCDLAGVTS
jgi:ribonuclease HI